jgi:hypothetical protein
MGLRHPALRLMCSVRAGARELCGAQKPSDGRAPPLSAAAILRPPTQWREMPIVSNYDLIKQIGKVWGALQVAGLGEGEAPAQKSAPLGPQATVARRPTCSSCIHAPCASLTN